MKNLYHRAVAGDRWDLLAWIYYGNAKAIEPILRANPEVAHLLEPPEGLLVVIPKVEAEDIAPDADVNYSPWGV